MKVCAILMDITIGGEPVTDAERQTILLALIALSERYTWRGDPYLRGQQRAVDLLIERTRVKPKGSVAFKRCRVLACARSSI